MMRDLNLAEYRALAELRYQIRCFLHFSEEQVRETGLEPQQHQLLLAVRGLPDGKVATVGELAERLQLKHHSVVELVDRLERRAFVSRRTSQEDRRRVVVTLTPVGSDILRRLSLAHHQELENAGPRLIQALRSLARPKVSA